MNFNLINQSYSLFSSSSLSSSPQWSNNEDSELISLFYNQRKEIVEIFEENHFPGRTRKEIEERVKKIFHTTSHQVLDSMGDEEIAALGGKHFDEQEIILSSSVPSEWLKEDSDKLIKLYSRQSLDEIVKENHFPGRTRREIEERIRKIFILMTTSQAKPDSLAVKEIVQLGDKSFNGEKEAIDLTLDDSEDLNSTSSSSKSKLTSKSRKSWSKKSWSKEDCSKLIDLFVNQKKTLTEICRGKYFPDYSDRRIRGHIESIFKTSSQMELASRSLKDVGHLIAMHAKTHSSTQTISSSEKIDESILETQAGEKRKREAVDSDQASKGTSESSSHKKAKRVEIQSHVKSKRNMRQSAEDRAKLIDLFVNQKKTEAEISEGNYFSGFAPRTIRYWLASIFKTSSQKDLAAKPLEEVNRLIEKSSKKQLSKRSIFSSSEEIDKPLLETQTAEKRKREVDLDLDQASLDASESSNHKKAKNVSTSRRGNYTRFKWSKEDCLKLIDLFVKQKKTITNIFNEKHFSVPNSYTIRNHLNLIFKTKNRKKIISMSDEEVNRLIGMHAHKHLSSQAVSSEDERTESDQERIEGDVEIQSNNEKSEVDSDQDSQDRTDAS